MARIEKNIFCRKSDLGNEASVEGFFASRLLEELGYDDSQIKTKESIEALAVSQGRNKYHYKPDYTLIVDDRPRWVLDAKAVGENLDSWTGQCSSYCLMLNQRLNGNPVEYYVLTNGIDTRVYKWDEEQPVLVLPFGSFKRDDALFQSFLKLMSPNAFGDIDAVSLIAPSMVLRKVSPGVLNDIFAKAHNYIYKHEHLSTGAAFTEFVKIIFLKMTSDKEMHAHPEASFDAGGNLVVPSNAVRFSTEWVNRAKHLGQKNPVDHTLFSNLRESLEELIRTRRKKRIFDQGEGINLKPSTIEHLVGLLEDVDLHSIDTDLNGRMFETFLNSTLRGKALGQYFTPRSAVKLAVNLARLEVDRDFEKCDKVLDGCCGTGGFLIDALASMWSKIDANGSMSNQEKAAAREYVAECCMWGVDAAKDPALARIARMNMYLHGDGGSNIYQLDTLDKNPDTGEMPSSLREEYEEFKTMADSQGFDVVLTNPPFASEYRASDSHNKSILENYEIAFKDDGAMHGTVRSSVLFFERYHDLLKEGGRLVTVIDDGILGGSDNTQIRDWIRSHFLVRAIVSLPGDAFQRSEARVKTSILVLEKRLSEGQEQPPVFVEMCSSVGVDDPHRRRSLPQDATVRKRAEEEVARIGALYERFLSGDSEVVESCSVSGAMIADRMDVKTLIAPLCGYEDECDERSLTLGAVMDVVWSAGGVLQADRDCDLLLKSDAAADDLVTFAKISYAGEIQRGDTVYRDASSYSKIFCLRAGDIAVSNINAVHGAISVVPSECDGLVVSNEVTVLRPSEGWDAGVLCEILRSAPIRARMLMSSTGMGRTRVSWESIQGIELPHVPSKMAEEMKALRSEVAEAQRRAKRAGERLSDLIEGGALAPSGRDMQILEALKPPK